MDGPPPSKGYSPTIQRTITQQSQNGHQESLEENKINPYILGEHENKMNGSFKCTDTFPSAILYVVYVCNSDLVELSVVSKLILLPKYSLIFRWAPPLNDLLCVHEIRYMSPILQ